MKTKLLYLIFGLFVAFNTNAQDSLSNKRTIIREIPVYRDVDVMATYRGGYEVILKQIETATKNCRRGSFKGKDAVIVIDVLITDKGKIAKIEFVKSPTDLCNDAIKSTIENATQWIPGRINNKPVNSYLQLTVNLKNTRNSNSNAINRL
ncbi:hypothetical protein NU10_10030 [Flavobacterium dauae]|uniref:hypothetical protein n=1 Tax=Flavobacterium dauae TaxID=1563479 RepID=UPI00101B4519|nr:hypothetical protein [Flavobacterium dauae]WLD23046.1 hypothetical protein NU10_10030 [Flavobacterium dauae]